MPKDTWPIKRVDVNAENGQLINGAGSSFGRPMMSSDGRYITFTSSESNVVT